MLPHGQTAQSLPVIQENEKFSEFLERIELHYIKELLKKYNWNLYKINKHHKITRYRLYKKIEKHNLRGNI